MSEFQARCSIVRIMEDGVRRLVYQGPDQYGEDLARAFGQADQFGRAENPVTGHRYLLSKDTIINPPFTPWQDMQAGQPFTAEVSKSHFVMRIVGIEPPAPPAL